jgi:hypothetical protein
MTDENVQDVFDGAVEDAEHVDDVVVDASPDPAEEKPAPRGYMSKDAWIEAGRDPEDWVSPEVFKERGERIKMKAEYDNRFKNLSMYYQKQMELQRNDLLARRDEAIDTADKAAVKKIDKELKELDEIEQLNKVEDAPAIVKPPEVVEWEEENPWCNDPSDPRLALAQRVYKAAVNSGKTPATALRMVDKELAAKFIDTSRKPAQIAEGSRQSSGKHDDGKPSMATLTSEERKIWEAGIFESKDDFLKAVQDDRKLKAGKK